MRLRKTNSSNALALIASDPKTLSQALIGFKGDRVELPEEWLYLVPETDGGMVVGVYCIHPFGETEYWQFHANTLTMFWGTGIPDEATTAVIQWLREHDFMPIVAKIPEEEKVPQQHAARNGFKQVKGTTLWRIEE